MKIKNLILLSAVLCLVIFSQCSSNRAIKYQNRAYKKVHHPIEKTSDFKNKNKYQKDFLILANIVKDAYPNCQEFITEEQWQKSVNEIMNNLSEANEKEAVLAYQKFLAQLKNNHTVVAFPSLISLNDNIFALAIYFLNNKWTIFNVHPEYPEILIKAELLAINDFPAETIYNKVKDYICAESEEMLRYSAYSQLMLLQPELLKHLGFSYKNSPDSLKLTIKDSLQTERTLVVPSVNWRKNFKFSKKGYPIRQQKIETDSGFVYRFFPEQKIAYLQLNTFIDRRAMVKGIKAEVPVVFWPFAFNMLRKAYKGKPSPRMNLVKSGTENISTFYEEFFTKVKTNNSKYLIIDIRNNPGGDMFYVYQLLKFLSPRTDLNTFSRFIKYSDFYKKMNNTKNIEKNLANLSKQKIVFDTLLNISSLEDDYNVFEKMQNPKFEYYINTKDKVFEGKVFVLTSQNSASAATVFPVLVQDNKLGVIVGRSPANRTAKQTSFIRFKLPNTSIVISISPLYLLRPDINNPSEILIPDYPVPVQLLRNDYTLEYVLNLIETKSE